MNKFKTILQFLILSFFSINASAENAITSDVLISQGDHAFSAGLYKQALVHYQNASPTTDDTTVLYVKIARCFQYLGIQSSALSVTDKILAEVPEQVDALLIKGEIAEANKNHEQALALYKQVEQLDPANQATYYNQANVLRKMGRETDAEKALSNIKK